MTLKEIIGLYEIYRIKIIKEISKKENKDSCMKDKKKMLCLWKLMVLIRFSLLIL